MEVDDEPSINLSPMSKLHEFQMKVKNFQSSLESVDYKDLDDPHKCAEYAKDIHENMRKEEDSHLVRPNYMEQQNDINEKMRAILVDWLVEVHLKFKLVPETLYLTISLIDRYLE